MNAKAEQAFKLSGNGLGHEGMLERGRWTLDARLKKLRWERRLIDRAILTLTEIAQTRHSRARRASRV
ncbi:MAG: hypothetical protein ACLPWF_10080 [Bryobacteraceae bacterium]